MSVDFQLGERVNITIEGARVVGWHAGLSELSVETSAAVNSDETTFDLTSSHVTVERADPDYWPPRSGDLLQHKTGAVWFAVATGSNVVFRNHRDGLIEYQVAWEARHDLTLIHREGASLS